MNITKSDFKKIEAVRSLLPSGGDLETLPEEQKKIIFDFDIVLLNLYKKGLRDNERARLYMNEKRAEDPLFGRPVAYKEERRAREARRQAQKDEAEKIRNYFKEEV